ncbi:6-phosphogluconolactonase [Leptospira yasudae]|uniref:6-phosphogluconolactonase n=1 Tax=Leptospira yasudae TaxID=2202201 RepID=UPI000E59C756|nr:6-phosphogluconolactonase [Leptospira yasudae]RHX91300.1 6-phosphogluconolactonase [Leptospira yasudae]
MIIVEFSDEREFLTHCLRKIKEISDKSIQVQNSFRIVLTGGDTAKLLYSQLKYLETDWSKWYFYFGDERCVSMDHPDSNALMADKSLFEFTPIRKEQIFRIPGHLGAEQAAFEYANSIRTIISFDLVLLGLGEDGHIASLFPGCDLSTDKDVLTVHDSPKLPKERVSLSLKRMNLSDNILIITKGRNKTEIIRRIKLGEKLPVTSLLPKKTLELYYFSG